MVDNFAVSKRLNTNLGFCFLKPLDKFQKRCSFFETVCNKERKGLVWSQFHFMYSFAFIFADYLASFDFDELTCRLV